jgi:hexosaminidase
MEGSGLEKIAALLNDHIKQQTGYLLKNTSKYSSPNSIVLNYERLDNALEGAYNFTADNKGIYIAGDNAAGVLNGVQTLIQLLQKTSANKQSPSLTIPQLSIHDYPRFAYRGMHLDVARHFMPVSTVKKYIDYLAMYKFNTFHWHLTDDQGWRIEIKKYPKLTEVGGWRNGTIVGHYPGTANDSIVHGGFYTQEQIKEVLQYAADRYITVVPEIEMPGHASAAIAAYPQLSCFPDEDTKHKADCPWAGTSNGKQVQQTWGVFEDVFCPSAYTFNFLQDVLDEVIALFPSEYIHIGGDECPKESWKRSEFCQQLMKKNNLKDEHALQSYFIQRIERYINSKGRKIIGWDEILEGGLAPNATVMSWRGEEGGIEAARQNHDVVMTPGNYCYFDQAQTANEDSVTIGGYLPLEQVYKYDPIPAALNTEQAKHILGAQANVWTEYIGNVSKLEYSIFPRMAAMAEVLWTPKAKKSWKDFERRLPLIMQSFKNRQINYSKAYYAIKGTAQPTEKYDAILWKLSSNAKETIFVDATGTDSIVTYKKPLFINKTTTVSAALYDSKIYAYQDFHFNKATAKKITLTTPASTQYPGDGAFTLVNGIQNEKGFTRVSEFIGFEGKDCEAIIDLGLSQKVSSVTVHALHQKSSWIWRPSTVEALGSADGKTFTRLGLTDDFEKAVYNRGSMTINFDQTNIRYIKVLVKNWGTIPDGEAGAGNNAWLFVDEIEVD